MYYLLQSYTDCKSKTMFSIFLSAVIALFVSFSSISCHGIDLGLTDHPKAGWAIAHPTHPSPTSLNVQMPTRVSGSVSRHFNRKQLATSNGRS